MTAIDPKLRQVDAEVRTRIEGGRKLVTTNWPLLARKVTGGVGRNLYAAMDDLPKIQKKNQGGYKTAEPSSTVYELNAADFGLIMKMLKNDVDDDKWGVYAGKLQVLGQRMEQFPDHGLFSLLKEGDTSTYQGQNIDWVDALPFFSAVHKVNTKNAGLGTFSNLLSGKDLTDAADFASVYASFLTLPDTENQPINQPPNRLIVPPALEDAAAKLVQARTVSTGGDNMSSNEALAARRRPRIEVVVDAALAGDDTTWYLAYQEGDVGPMVFQETEALHVISKISESDDNVAYDREYHWIVQGRAAFGWSDPRLIIRSAA